MSIYWTMPQLIFRVLLPTFVQCGSFVIFFEVFEPSKTFFCMQNICSVANLKCLLRIKLVRLNKVSNKLQILKVRVWLGWTLLIISCLAWCVNPFFNLLPYNIHSVLTADWIVVIHRLVYDIFENWKSIHAHRKKKNDFKKNIM